jgi:hypothetical protein
MVEALRASRRVTTSKGFLGMLQARRAFQVSYKLEGLLKFCKPKDILESYNLQGLLRNVASLKGIPGELQGQKVS